MILQHNAMDLVILCGYLQLLIEPVEISFMLMRDDFLLLNRPQVRTMYA